MGRRRYMERPARCAQAVSAHIGTNMQRCVERMHVQDAETPHQLSAKHAVELIRPLGIIAHRAQAPREAP